MLLYHAGFSYRKTSTGLSYRKTSTILRPLESFSHEALRRWYAKYQRYAKYQSLFSIKRWRRTIAIDEIKVKIEGKTMPCPTQRNKP